MERFGDVSSTTYVKLKIIRYHFFFVKPTVSEHQVKLVARTPDLV
jgi:hypothetical protein